MKCILTLQTVGRSFTLLHPVQVFLLFHTRIHVVLQVPTHFVIFNLDSVGPPGVLMCAVGDDMIAPPLVVIDGNYRLITLFSPW